MEDIKNLIFSTPFQLVLDHFLQNSDLEMTDSQVINDISGAKRAAIQQALLRLSQCGIIERHHRERRCFNRLEQTLPWIAPLKIVSNILSLDPFIRKISSMSLKAILFGSRATGSNTSDSDYDILIISNTHEKVTHAAMKESLSEKLQLIIKTPEEFLDFDTREPVLAENIRKGITLWEK